MEGKEELIVEDLINELQKITTEEQMLIERKAEIIRKIKTAPKDAWDWVSVKEASFLVGKSNGFIYSRINAGKLETRYFGASVLVRKSEVMGINDKYQRKVEAEI